MISLWKLREKKNVAQMPFVKNTPVMVADSREVMIFIVFSDYCGNASFLILSVRFMILPPPAT